MGCKCEGGTYDKLSIENILKENIKIITENPIKSENPLTDYVKKVFFLINKVRTNPSDFADIVDYYKKFIIAKDGRKIFSHKVNVYLNQGEPMFQECSEYLRKLSPMGDLTFNDKIVLECPNEPGNIKDMNFFKLQVCEQQKKEKIEAYFKDSIKEPEISVLLMIVDDSVKNPKKKRETILNPKFTQIGISSSDFCKDENNNNNSVNVSFNQNNMNNKKNNNESGNKGNVNGNNNKPFCAYFSFK